MTPLLIIHFLTQLSWITSLGTYVKSSQKDAPIIFYFAVFQIMDYFSYEHFYVIYCKFWELDADHDLLIDENDLMRHNNHGKYDSKLLVMILDILNIDKICTVSN